MIHILEIPKVRDYDSGHLRIVAKNPVGAVECTSSLSVMARDDWRSRLKQAPRCTLRSRASFPRALIARLNLGCARDPLTSPPQPTLSVFTDVIRVLGTCVDGDAFDGGEDGPLRRPRAHA